ncbi:31289_t:CDS:2 [Racocetra persica]|uniref:31289_t:CDS:1 n=1 Tax=Racocetra persica TaxID=160502 RepID=A0ACA9LYK6_9GLOM|nr:31289_t:CDS:2 [Racocetra persica]
MSSDPNSPLQSQNSSNNQNATLPTKKNKKTVRKIKTKRTTNVVRNSFVHFFYVEDFDLQTAQCKICIEKFKDTDTEAYIYQTHGSTTNLRNHLKEHGINELNYKNFRRFAPTGDNTIESYIDLIYGPISSEDTDETNDINSSTDNNAEDSASKKFQAAIYLSLDKLWNVLDEVALLATILDPCLKGECINIQEKLQIKYEELSCNLNASSLTQVSSQEIIQVEKDKVTQYINFPEALENDSPLTW